MDEGNSRRSLSPYHEKCFPPYCDNAQQVDKSMVTKMARGDLEDKYITFADENLELKKQNRNHERQIQRLQTAIQRQDRLDKRAGFTPTSHMADGNKVAILEAQNKNLQAKIKVLKQQLMNHSFIHSKEGRINDAKTRQAQGKTPRESDSSITQPQSAREIKPDKSVAALKTRVAELEYQLETQKKKFKDRIAQLEKELSALEKEAGRSGTSVNEQLSETSRQVKDNKELIKLRMQAEKQAAELEELREKLAAAEAEMERLRKELKEAKDRADDLQQKLDRERNKSRDAISEASRGTTHMETIRALEEQIRDLQKEKDTLKDANEKLLQLTQSKSDRSTSGHSFQIAQLDKSLKEKLEELKEKEERIRELEWQLEEAEKALEKAKRALADGEKAGKPAVSPSQSQQHSASSLLGEARPQLELLVVIEGRRRHSSLLNFAVQKYWQNVKIYEALVDINRHLVQTCASKKECENCVDLSKQLCAALMEVAKLKARLEEAKKPKEPTSPKFSETNSELGRLRDEVQSLREKVDDLNREIERLRDKESDLENKLTDVKNQLSDASNELDTLRPIAVEHEGCSKVQLPTTSPNEEALKKEKERLQDELDDLVKEIDKLRPIAAEHEKCLNKTPLPSTSSREDALKKEKERLEDELNELLKEIEKLRAQNENADALKREKERLEDELNDLLKELDKLRPIAAEHEQCLYKTPLRSSSSKEDALKKEKERLEDELNNLLKEIEKLRAQNENADALKAEKKRLEDELNDLLKEIEKLQAENEKAEALKNENERLEDELNDLLKELDKLRRTAAEHEKCRKTPLPSASSKDDALKRQNMKMEGELNRAWTELSALRPIVEEHKSIRHNDPTPTSSKSVQVPSHTSHFSSVKATSTASSVKTTSTISSVKAPSTHTSAVSQGSSSITSEDSVHSKKTIDSERYTALSKQLQEALWENERLKKELAERDDDDPLKRKNQELEDELTKALRELREVMPIVEEHNRMCPHKEAEQTRSFMQQYPRDTPSPSPGHSAYVVTDYPKEQSPQPSIKEYPKEKSATPSIAEYPKEESTQPSIKEYPKEKSATPSIAEYSKAKSATPSVAEYSKAKSAAPSIAEYPKEKSATPSVADYPKEYSIHTKEKSRTPSRQASPVQSVSIRKERRNKKWPDAKKVISNARKEEIQLESSEGKPLDVIMEMTDDENLKDKKSVLPKKYELKEENSDLQLKNRDTVRHSKKGTAGSQLKNVEMLSEVKSSLYSRLDDVSGESKKSSLTPTLVTVERLLRRRAPLRSSTVSHSLGKSSPPSEEEEQGPVMPKLGVPNVANPESIHRSVLFNQDPSKFIPHSEEISLSDNKVSSVQYEPSIISDRASQVKRPLVTVTPSDRVKRALIKHRNREDILHDFFDQAPPPRPDYVSHVTPLPSVHCVETVDINDPEQKANLLIVSKHDFDTVLMQKKRYSAEVEVVEPVDGRQTLNCKLEICMYDLEIEAKMLEYLTSLQSEPKVYVEWSFVGLDQRTAPLPAEQALFYTNVIYYGPLSSEVKKYLTKVEMPIDLYLVRSSGAPMKVAEGTLDMLPAMEQPNRGFMRSVFLRGKDLPSKYNSDRAMATIHCSFILHECCLGDPPFKDQLEVAIGTLYLKNRDGGVVPDHATHIYIEYALLGHCGPELETDSVPRGEVMKFNHSKKLRVSDENAPHLKSMLNDNHPRPLRFTVLAEPCSLTTDTEVETVGHADINLNEEMIRKDRDLVSSQVPVYSTEGEHLGTLSVTVLGISTLQQIYGDGRKSTR